MKKLFLGLLAVASMTMTAIGFSACDLFNKTPVQTESLQFQKIKDKEEYRVVGLGNVSSLDVKIPEKYKEMMKRLNCAWGCDECQKACPYNIKAEKTTIKEFIESFNPKVTEETPIEGRAFEWRGEKVIKRNLQVLDGKS